MWHQLQTTIHTHVRMVNLSWSTLFFTHLWFKLESVNITLRDIQNVLACHIRPPGPWVWHIWSKGKISYLLFIMCEIALWVYSKQEMCNWTNRPYVFCDGLRTKVFLNPVNVTHHNVTHHVSRPMSSAQEQMSRFEAKIQPERKQTQHRISNFPGELFSLNIVFKSVFISGTSIHLSIHLSISFFTHKYKALSMPSWGCSTFKRQIQ